MNPGGIVAEIELKPDAIYLYRPKHTWCKHGICLTAEKDGVLFAADTYWGGGTVFDWEHAQPASELDIFQYVGLQKEFEQIGYREKPRTFDWYADSDVLFIPVGGRAELYLLRKGAVPVQVKAVACIRAEIQYAEAQIRWSTQQIEKLKQELQQYSSH